MRRGCHIILSLLALSQSHLVSHPARTLEEIANKSAPCMALRSLGAGRRPIGHHHPQHLTTLDVARAILAHKPGFKQKCRDGLTALMLAAPKSQIQLVGLLVRSGANAKLASPDGKTAIDIARSNGNHQAVSILRLLEQPNSN